MLLGIKVIDSVCTIPFPKIQEQNDVYSSCVYRKKIWKDKDRIVHGASYLAGVRSGPPTATAVVTTIATTPAG